MVKLDVYSAHAAEIIPKCSATKTVVSGFQSAAVAEQEESSCQVLDFVLIFKIYKHTVMLAFKK